MARSAHPQVEDHEKNRADRHEQVAEEGRVDLRGGVILWHSGLWDWLRDSWTPALKLDKGTVTHQHNI